MVSQEEVQLEPVEVDQAQSRTLSPLAVLVYLGVRKAGPLDVDEWGCFFLNQGKRKPRR